MNTATIFYNDAKLLAGEPCFDSRFEGQMLPAGSVVVGFLVVSLRGDIQHLLAPPYMTGGQHQQYLETLLQICEILRPERAWDPYMVLAQIGLP